MTKIFKIAFIMDPIHTIDPKKDTTLRLILEAQALGWEIDYLEPQDLFLDQALCMARSSPIEVFEDPLKWWSLKTPKEVPLNHFDAILMRKDPPITMEYIYTTQLLEKAEQQGVYIMNRPSILRDANEKLFTTWFPECMAPTRVAANMDVLKQFTLDHKEVVFKPLKGMAGQGIFRSHHKDPNLSVILETLTREGTEYCMAQKFIPAIEAGDKRILLIDGQPFPYALARIPKTGDFRGNLARGASILGVELSAGDRLICEHIAPTLVEKGVLFAGIDVIGDYLTEINITSPTCVRQLEKLYTVNIAGKILDCLAQKLKQKH